MTSTSYRDALREAHRDALQRDPRVILMGEDVEQRRKYIEEHALEVKNLDV